jgi:hypothetical protein
MSGPVISSIASRGMPPSRSRRVPSGPGRGWWIRRPPCRARHRGWRPPRPQAVDAHGRRRRADPARGVGRGRGQRAVGLLQQRLHHRVRGDAYGDTGSPAVTAGARGAPGAMGRTSVRAPGQKATARASAPRGQGRDAPDGIDVRHMHDQRIERGPPLGREDARHCVGVRRVGGQPVDGLRRHGHESAPPQKRRGACDRRLAGIEHLGDLIGHS